MKLEYYRLQKISEGSISLKEGQAKPLDGPQEVGSGLLREEPVALSRLIDLVNERFGTDFTEADQLFFDQIVEAAMTDENLKQAAKVNPEDKFSLVFNNLLETLFIERMDQNEESFARYMNDPAFQSIVAHWLAGEVYRRLGGVPIGRAQYPSPKRKAREPGPRECRRQAGWSARRVVQGMRRRGLGGRRQPPTLNATPPLPAA